MFLLLSSSSVGASAADTARCHQSPNRIANGGQRVSELMARRHSSFSSSSSSSLSKQQRKGKEPGPLRKNTASKNEEDLGKVL